VTVELVGLLVSRSRKLVLIVARPRSRPWFVALAALAEATALGFLFFIAPTLDRQHTSLAETATFVAVGILAGIAGIWHVVVCKAIIERPTLYPGEPADARLPKRNPWLVGTILTAASLVAISLFAPQRFQVWVVVVGALFTLLTLLSAPVWEVRLFNRDRPGEPVLIGWLDELGITRQQRIIISNHAEALRIADTFNSNRDHLRTVIDPAQVSDDTAVVHRIGIRG
jgi:hypothetical protein